MKREFLFTSESVTEGHPDKLCDQISDAVLDAVLMQDPFGRVACEVSVTTGLVLVFGEISTTGYVDIPNLVRSVIREAGYTRAKYGFDADTCGIITSINEQSPDIARGVDAHGTFGAGDQGLMFGYACKETPEYMPTPIVMAHDLARKLAEVRKNGSMPFLRPDGKTQVTIKYVNGRPAGIDTVVVSAQHSPNIEMRELRDAIYRDVISPIVHEKFEHIPTQELKLHINPTGRFVIGGPQGDSGLTGRKIIVDTYGGWARHGGGCFSGKDATKVDRSASYMARYIAKNLVANWFATECEVQLAYAIGVSEPVSIMVETFGTATVSDERLLKVIRGNFDMTPRGMMTLFNLREPIFRQTATYGHFGRLDLDLPWEKLIILD